MFIWISLLVSEYSLSLEVRLWVFFYFCVLQDKCLSSGNYWYICGFSNLILGIQQLNFLKIIRFIALYNIISPLIDSRLHHENISLMVPHNTIVFLASNIFYLLTAFPKKMISLPPSLRVALQKWCRTTMRGTMIMMMTIATQINTQTTLLEYPLSLQYPAAKLQECPQKTQCNSKEWFKNYQECPTQKTRYMTMLYLPSFQVTMIAMIILMKRMRI